MEKFDYTMQVEVQQDMARLMQAMLTKTAQEEWEAIAEKVWLDLSRQEERWIDLEGPVWDGDRLASFGVGTTNRLRLVANAGRVMRAVGIWPGAVISSDDNTYFALHHVFRMLRDAMTKLNGGPLAGLAKPMSRQQCVDAWKAAEAGSTGAACAQKPVNGIRLLGADGTMDGVGAVVIVGPSGSWDDMLALPEFLVGIFIGQWQTVEGRTAYTRAWAYNHAVQLAPDAISLEKVAESTSYKAVITFKRDLSVELASEDVHPTRAALEKAFAAAIAPPTPERKGAAETTGRLAAKEARAGGRTKTVIEQMKGTVVHDVPSEIGSDTEVEDDDEDDEYDPKEGGKRLASKPVDGGSGAGTRRCRTRSAATGEGTSTSPTPGSATPAAEDKKKDGAAALPPGRNLAPPGWGEVDTRVLCAAAMDFECVGGVRGGLRFVAEGAIVVMDLRNDLVMGHSVGLFAKDMPVSMIPRACAASAITGLPP